MSAINIIENNIDRVIKDLAELDVRIATGSGNVSVGMTQLREMSDTLKANAAKAVYAPKVTSRDLKVYDAVMNQGHSISYTGNKFCCSPSTVRRILDRVQDNQRAVGNS